MNLITTDEMMLFKITKVIHRANLALEKKQKRKRKIKKKHEKKKNVIEKIIKIIKNKNLKKINKQKN